MANGNNRDNGQCVNRYKRCTCGNLEKTNDNIYGYCKFCNEVK